MIQKHWSFIYIVNRIKNFYFEKTNPNLPWVNPQAIYLLNELLKKEDVGVEFGSGSSTVWFSNRVKHLISIEDNKDWFDKISKQLHNEGVKNVTYIFKKSDEKKPIKSDYYQYLKPLDDESIDFIIIDGKHRDVLALEAISKIKKGGFIYIDDSQRYIPHQTNSPHSIHNSKNKTTPNWQQFIEKTNNWRKIWTTNGVSDATFFIKK